MSKLKCVKIENQAFDNRVVTLKNEKHTIIIHHHDISEKIAYVEGEEYTNPLKAKAAKEDVAAEPKAKSAKKK